MKTTIYTDGSCKKNPGPGGYAFAVYKDDGKVIGFYGRESDTTNNRMELLGVIKALEFLNDNEADESKVYSDSKYVVDGINSWIKNWKKNNWKTAGRQDVKNKDLWQRLDALIEKMQKVDILWVKGHDVSIGNDMADRLANFAALDSKDDGISEFSSLSEMHDITEDCV